MCVCECECVVTIRGTGAAVCVCVCVHVCASAWLPHVALVLWYMCVRERDCLCVYVLFICAVRVCVSVCGSNRVTRMNESYHIYE